LHSLSTRIQEKRNDVKEELKLLRKMGLVKNKRLKLIRPVPK